MSGIIFYWEQPAVLVHEKIQKKLISRWTLTAKAFGISNICVIDVDGIEPIVNDSEIKFTIVKTLEEALNLFSNSSKVWVEQGGEPLVNFKHPKDAVYIFGSDFGQLPEATVEIPISQGIHSDIACGIILADRLEKWH
jgi:hypothetical protein